MTSHNLSLNLWPCEICPPGHEKQQSSACESNDVTLDKVAWLPGIPMLNLLTKHCEILYTKTAKNDPKMAEMV